MAKSGKPFSVCWNCSGKGHVSSQCPSPSTSLNGRSDKGKSPKKDDKHPSGGSDNSTNDAVSSEVDGIWSAFEPADLYDNDVSPAECRESLQCLVGPYSQIFVQYKFF